MQIAQLEKHFPPQVRGRALDYARAVRVLEQAPNHLHVHIRGADDYCVRLDRSARALGVSCTCPYFDSTGPCKHIWGALLHAQRIDTLSGEPSPDRIVRQAVVPHDRTARRRPSNPTVVQSEWRTALAALAEPSSDATLPVGAEIAYVVDVAASAERGAVQLEIGMRTRKKNGELSMPRTLSFDRAGIATLSDAVEREVMTLIAALSGGRYGYVANRLELPQGLASTVLHKAAMLGRLSIRDGALATALWDADDPYELVLVAAQHDELRTRGVLRRRDESLDVQAPLAILPEGLVFFSDRIARITASQARWAKVLREHGGELRVPDADAHEFALAVMTQSSAPSVELPETLQLKERRVPLRPRLALWRAAAGAMEQRGRIFFEYDDVSLEELDSTSRVAAIGSKEVLVRDLEGEARTRAQLTGLGARRDLSGWLVPTKKLGEIITALMTSCWRIDVEQHHVRAPGSIDVSVRSHIDWFDLSADVHYGALTVGLPALLAAARRGERFVTLTDGTLGLIPEDWLARNRLVGELGEVNGDALRFAKGQIGVLDALLAAMPEADLDQQVVRARAAIARFSSLTPKAPPAGFVGTLRAYQEAGLGWLDLLREAGLGGCLADDMGLGKTIQVLALLEGRRRSAKSPSLVVVPKSLLFNWQREAQRFTPQLRVLEHHGQKRSLTDAASYDLIVTTYGTLVRDAALFHALELDYAILDEAQAIKNSRTDAAKAARLLRARHRLVLTGTPIENRLSDLWSLFEFLNPGMLGSSKIWKRVMEGGTDERAERALLGRALRPFLLRRTKDQVAADLPPKTEQIIYCELEGEERTQYDELRTHYRSTLLGLVEQKGIERSQIHILEALLRLRQAACHPALIDPSRDKAPSAKLTALLAQIEDVVAGGHKAVVFSQFTSLLAVVRKHLAKASIDYEYLDGKTRDRSARVDRFQTDPACGVFLVSLKAGGVGLNLTAAEYVFLLDPWWNPAVEAQAIDRAHRIGQTKPVIAYRLIGRDTIEEKVLALQDQKRALASAIVDTDHALVGGIGKEELELLLS